MPLLYLAQGDMRIPRHVSCAVLYYNSSSPSKVAHLMLLGQVFAGNFTRLERRQ